MLPRQECWTIEAEQSEGGVTSSWNGSQAHALRDMVASRIVPVLKGVG